MIRSPVASNAGSPRVLLILLTTLAAISTAAVARAQAPTPQPTPQQQQPQQPQQPQAPQQEPAPAPQEATPPGPQEGAVPAPPAGEGEVAPDGTPPQPSDQPGQLRLAVVDAASYGVDPVVGQHVTQQMRETGAAMGYAIVDREATVAAAQSIRMAYPPAPADLWRVTYAAQAQRGAFARVWAHAGSYVIEITVASLDGAGPFFARGTAGATDLHAVVDRLLRQALPPPAQWTGMAGTAAEQPRPQAPVADPFAPAQPQPPAAAPARPEEPEPPPIRHRWNIVLQTEGAIGTSQDSFYNHLVGGRIDYRISREILFGLYVGYANLRGKDGRANNVLTYLQIEDRVRLGSATDITIPLRLGIGYLPFNGPVVRLAAGINIPLSRRVELGFDILVPTFWVLPDRTAVSLDLAAELLFRL